MPNIDLIEFTYLLGVIAFAARTVREFLSTPYGSLHWAALGLASSLIWPAMIVAVVAIALRQPKDVELARHDDFI